MIASKAMLKKLAPTEHDEQALLIATCEAYSGRYPELALIFAIPNQGRMGGFKGKLWGTRLQREGLRKGVPDLFLPVARYPKGIGLFLEMKRAHGGTVSPEQRHWEDRLLIQGYAVAICNGANQGWSAIVTYLGLPSDLISAVK